MGFIDAIIQDPGYVPYKIGLILSEFQRSTLIGFTLLAAWTGALVASQLHELNWFGKTLVTVAVTALVFGLVVSLSYLAPVFFDPGALVESQKVKP